MGNFENAKVLVREGWLQGYNEGSLHIFKGVPFAAPPVGELRFRHPQPARRWRGIRKATAYSAAAIQHVMDDETAASNVHGIPQLLAPSQYEEDCLYLNIWSPAKTQDAKLPVFIWIHGGGMVAGSGVECVCDGTGLASRKDCIVVTFNYRLGFFGFFAHPDLTKEAGGTSGNYAFYDMIAAVRWIKENISQFGGDPDNITLAGQSGGARSNGILLASPLMKGLVKNISIESGIIYWGFSTPPAREVMEQKGVAFMERVGCKTIEELRQKDAWELFDEAEKLPYFDGFSFCVDGELLPEHYPDWMEALKFNDFNVMMGSCGQEFPVVKGEFTVDDLHKYLEEGFPGHGEDMKKWYPATNSVEAAKAATTIASDFMLMGAIKIADLVTKKGNHAFVWHMTKENETQKGRDLGSPHCAEMSYLFGRVDKGERDPFFDYHWVGADYDFMELIQNYWYTYAATGNPTNNACPEWKSYNGNFDVMELNNHSHMWTDEEKEKYAYYWSKINGHRDFVAMKLGQLIDLKNY